MCLLVVFVNYIHVFFFWLVMVIGLDFVARFCFGFQLCLIGVFGCCFVGLRNPLFNCVYTSVEVLTRESSLFIVCCWFLLVEALLFFRALGCLR